ncbi:hypothetical protein HMPREF1624_00174 [Sporothrix schenckii ATCC 58251]|uniref:GRF-type domain-containing protein n=1 Tax=Sporothrix schenckii (strain ATCC 58251 / de Perez 2211183) TaxID=1391915 RepID=U7Q4G5_SPOS1|nr:hypothetical protein HMPREF1624_00174 [Sporothrix schenckii ATCC 58251]
MPRGGRRIGGRRSQPSTPRTTRTSNPATPSSGRGSDGLFANGQWFCDCRPRRPAVLRETRKPGANKGRWFYTCPQERRRQCTFFLWEDYAGASGGGAGPPSSQAPRPTYRTSIGQRTTPPAERQDGPASPHTTLAGQRSLPPPAPEQTPRQRQRIFTTAIANEFPQDMAYGDYENLGGEDEDNDEDDGFEPPPTPTPARARRTSGRAAQGASLDATQTLPPAPTETPSRPITKYFGVVKTNGSGKDGESAGGSSSGKNGAATGQAQRAEAPGRTASDYSDSEFDSDMERALVALVDHSERKTRWQSDAAGQGAGAKIKQTDDVNDGGSPAMDVEEGGERRRRIIFPVREELQEQETPTRRRLGHRLPVASDEYAAKEAAAEAVHAAASPTPPTPTPTAVAPVGATTTATATSFASLFGGSRNGAQQQPHPVFSFSSSVPSSQVASQASHAALSQAPTQNSVDTAAMTTPPSSFRSEVSAAGASTGSGRKRRQAAVDPWYGRPTQDGGNGESDDDGPFATPSKRVRFREDEATGTSAGPSQEAAPTSAPTTTTQGRSVPIKTEDEPGQPNGAVARQRRAEENEMHVDGEEDGPRGSQDASALPASPQPKDHNVTLAVLQLLAGQPIAPRVRQQVRALLNGAFAED